MDKTTELTAEEKALHHIAGPCPACQQTMLLDEQMAESYCSPRIGRTFSCP